MKEFMLKHPILTFLLADSLIAGLFNTIRAFAPKNPEANQEAEKEEGEEPKKDLAKSIENKEETV